MTRYAVFDIDGTIFRSGFFREIVQTMIANGTAPAALRGHFAVHEADWKARKRHDAFYDYEDTMARVFSDALPQIRIADYEAAVRSVFELMSDYVYAYTRDMLRELKEQGYFLIAISGSQHEAVELFARKYGFDHWVGQRYERGDDGYFTGRRLLTHDGKDKVLLGIIEQYGLSREGSIGVGDTMGDASMLAVVEKPLAFNPSRELFELAREKGWPVVVERKNVMYRLEPHGSTFILA